VAEYLRRAGAAGLSWPLPEELDEETLERRLFPVYLIFLSQSGHYRTGLRFIRSYGIKG